MEWAGSSAATPLRLCARTSARQPRVGTATEACASATLASTGRIAPSQPKGRPRKGGGTSSCGDALATPAAPSFTSTSSPRGSTPGISRGAGSSSARTASFSRKPTRPFPAAGPTPPTTLCTRCCSPPTTAPTTPMKQTSSMSPCTDPASTCGRGTPPTTPNVSSATITTSLRTRPPRRGSHRPCGSTSGHTSTSKAPGPTGTARGGATTSGCTRGTRARALPRRRPGAPLCSRTGRG
mmetsp:Transcript_10363/g.33471  ORF Transcript_10363/g.33471 Transcript_10363/m.33471 type:complete len:238 (-) Transcript_10363:1160-1873(-)